MRANFDDKIYRRRFTFVLLASVIIFGPDTQSARAADSSPSYNETIEFINQKLKKVERPEDWSYDDEISSPKKCQLRKNAYDKYTTWPKGHVNQSEINLQDLDPSRIEIPQGRSGAADAYMIELRCTNDTQCIRYTGKGANDSFKSDEVGSLEYLRVDDRRHAEQVAKALTHLVTMCGGKKEKF